MMRRREFITLLGGAAAAWPIAARAQQPAMPVIGFLHAVSPVGFTERLRDFRLGLKDAGYVEGENVTIEYRWAENQLDRLPALAAELARRQVAVMVTLGGTAPAIAAKALNTTIPVVFAVPEDPVKLGLVTSLGRPGGNLTGINFFTGELVAKRLELLRELVPAAARVAMFVNPANPARAELAVKEAETAGRAMGLQIRVFNVSTSSEINAAFATLGRDRPDALLVSPDPFFVGRRIQLANLHAMRYPRRIRCATRSRLAGSSVTEPMLRTPIVKSASILAASLRARSPQTCRSCSQSSSSWSSMPKRHSCSALKCRRRCSPKPTR